MGPDPEGLSASDGLRERRMPGPARPPWGELDAVLREVLTTGGSHEELLLAAEEVAFEEDLDLDRARARAEALWTEEGPTGEEVDPGV
jgi:hypothetical protein